jgi:peptidyl-tRNA hydrolase, PTH1 family
MVDTEGMGLFQKKPVAGTAVPLYTLGLNKTVLLMGLGNPGEKYEGTRHNIGFVCLDAFVRANDFPEWAAKKDLQCLMSSGSIGSTKVIVVKPQTFMNLSGEAVQAAAHFYKIPSENIVVIHDELDMPFGQIRTRTGGSSAGHNGVKSIIAHLGEGFGRVRIGVRNNLAEKLDSADFVLTKFTKAEQNQLPNLTRETTAILTEYLYSSTLPAETRTFLV